MVLVVDGDSDMLPFHIPVADVFILPAAVHDCIEREERPGVLPVDQGVYADCDCGDSDLCCTRLCRGVLH